MIDLQAQIFHNELTFAPKSSSFNSTRITIKANFRCMIFLIEKKFIYTNIKYFCFWYLT